jgi:hypothetical protein
MVPMKGSSASGTPAIGSFLVHMGSVVTPTWGHKDPSWKDECYLTFRRPVKLLSLKLKETALVWF